VSSVEIGSRDLNLCFEVRNTQKRLPYIYVMLYNRTLLYSITDSIRFPTSRKLNLRGNNEQFLDNSAKYGKACLPEEVVTVAMGQGYEMHACDFFSWKNTDCFVHFTSLHLIISFLHPFSTFNSFYTSFLHPLSRATPCKYISCTQFDKTILPLIQAIQIWSSKASFVKT
jgi:hypothetical protein